MTILRGRFADSELNDKKIFETSSQHKILMVSLLEVMNHIVILNYSYIPSMRVSLSREINSHPKVSQCSVYV